MASISKLFPIPKMKLNVISLYLSILANFKIFDVKFEGSVPPNKTTTFFTFSLNILGFLTVNSSLKHTKSGPQYVLLFKNLFGSYNALITASA